MPYHAMLACASALPSSTNIIHAKFWLQAGHATKPVFSQRRKAHKAAKRPGPQQRQPQQGAAVAASIDLWGANEAQPSTGWFQNS